jgi:hypothetical protein
MLISLPGSAATMTILPTGTCFDDAIEYLNEIALHGQRERLLTLKLVHGICLAPEGAQEGTPFAHAWVEEAGVCVQAGLFSGEPQKVYYGVKRAEFYAKLRVQVATYYTAPEVVVHNRRTGHFGPWEHLYRDLCQEYGAPVTLFQ